jgi:MinD superfamily P-loop ATPase
MMRIAVASGKGGTGKTTVAIALAESLSLDNDQIVLVSDCDVEAPNVHLYLDPDFKESRDVNVLIPQVDEDSCTGCGICSEVCQYNAIILLKDHPMVFPSLCHGCGSCMLNCPENAIQEFPNQIGILERGIGKKNIYLRQGLLNPGEPLTVPVIAALKKWNEGLSPQLEIIDSPPGASCPVVEAIRGVDFLLLVTEPTSFGLHDLKQAHQVANELGIRSGVIINRDGLGEADIEGYCRDNNIPLLMTIPLDKNIGTGLARGDTLLEIYPEYGDMFSLLYQEVNQIVKEVVD